MLDNMLTPFYHAPVPLWALVDAFFLYSFLGWCMECVVIRREKGAWENRGFVKSPFCIIYGFGAMLGYALLRPFSGNYVLLYVVGGHRVRIPDGAFDAEAVRLLLVGLYEQAL